MGKEIVVEKLAETPTILHVSDGVRAALLPKSEVEILKETDQGQFLLIEVSEETADYWKLI